MIRRQSARGGARCAPPFVFLTWSLVSCLMSPTWSLVSCLMSARQSLPRQQRSSARHRDCFAIDRVQTVLQCAPRARTQDGAMAKHSAKRFQKRAGTGAVSERIVLPLPFPLPEEEQWQSTRQSASKNAQAQVRWVKGERHSSLPTAVGKASQTNYAISLATNATKCGTMFALGENRMATSSITANFVMSDPKVSRAFVRALLAHRPSGKVMRKRDDWEVLSDPDAIRDFFGHKSAKKALRP